MPSRARPPCIGRPRASTPCSTTCAPRTPAIDWESCASGGGRVDLGVLERVQRVWASDMTDAVARQQIQRWTSQLVAPEYVGAHVSSPTSHTTGRTLTPGLPRGDGAVRLLRHRVGPDRGDRATTSTSSPTWVDAVQAVPSAAALGSDGPSGVARPDGAAARGGRGGPLRGAGRARAARRAAHNRGVSVRVPGLDPEASYDVAWEGPVEHRLVSMSSPLPEAGPDRRGGRLRARTGQPRVLDPAAQARDRDAGAPHAAVSGSRNLAL